MIFPSLSVMILENSGGDLSGNKKFNQTNERMKIEKHINIHFNDRTKKFFFIDYAG